MIQQKRWRTRLRRGAGSILLAAVLAVSPVGAGRAFASSGDVWLAAAEALGVAGAYSACLHEILTLGNNAYAQLQTLQMDTKSRGVDENTLDVQTVNQVMRQLTEKGEYVLDARSLPFRWQVNDNEEFNACCYPTNYISVNKGLVRGMECNPDEIAAVLGHEMTHGLRQHSAHGYAKAVAVLYGMAFLNISTGAMDGGTMMALADYSIAKNVTLPTEYEADEGGFYLMTSAGFNPGANAAAMARMQYYDENLGSYLGVYDPYDHPDTDKREARLAAMMTDYSCGHVSVKDRREILIDGKPLLTAAWTSQEYDNTAENAYFIAGGLAKAFHDYGQAADWDFQLQENGRITYLKDIPVYAMLRDFVAAHHAEGLLQQLVAEAYAGEEKSGARRAMHKAEQERRAERRQQWDKYLNTSVKNVRMMRVNGDTYNDMGQPELGLTQVNRAFACHQQDNLAENYSIRGRSLALLGRYTEAFADCDKAIELDPKSPYNYLNRSEAYRARGDREHALQDCRQAAKLDAKLPIPWQMMGILYDELGDKAGALESYRAYMKLQPKAEDVPEEYFSQIDPQRWKELKEKEAKAAKEAAAAEAEKKAEEAKAEAKDEKNDETEAKDKKAEEKAAAEKPAAKTDSSTAAVKS